MYYFNTYMTYIYSGSTKHDWFGMSQIFDDLKKLVDYRIAHCHNLERQ